MRFPDMNDDERLRRYLLGTMDEEQAGELEGRLLADGELFELAEAVEGDLLAAAFRGELPPAERGHLLRRLSASPGGRARLSLARGLNRISSSPRPIEAMAFQFLERPGVRAAALAASLLLAAGVFQLVTTTAIPGAGGKVDAMIARGFPAPLVLELALTGPRSAGGGIPRLEIPARAPKEVTLQLPLDAGETAASFAVILRDASTEGTIRSAEGITAQDVHGRRTIVLAVPSAQLRPGGTYEIEVRGTGPAGDELLGKPMFKVASSPS